MILLIPLFELPILPFLVLSTVFYSFVSPGIVNYLSILFLVFLPFLTTYSVGCFIDSTFSNNKLFSKYFGIISFLIFYTYGDALINIANILNEYSLVVTMKLIARSFEISSLLAVVFLILNLTIELPIRLVQRASASSIRFSYPALRMFLLIFILSFSSEILINFLQGLLYE